MSNEEYVVNLRRRMKEQGRTQAWLARKIGCSEVHLSKVLRGEVSLTEDFKTRLANGLGSLQMLATTHAGQSVVVPRSVVQRTVSQEACDYELAQAWRSAWVREHGAELLARESERAYLRALELVGAR